MGKNERRERTRAPIEERTKEGAPLRESLHGRFSPSRNAPVPEPGLFMHARVTLDRGGPAPILWGWAEVVGSPPRSREDSDLDARRPVYIASLDWPWPRLPPSIIPATSLAVACFATVTDVVVYACMPCSMSDWRAYVLRLLRDIMFSVPCICI